MTRKAPSPRSAYRAFFSVQTRWDDNDLYGHINNVTYLKYIDTVVALWQTGQGVDLGADADLRYLVVESGATYHSEARFPEQLHAGLRVGGLAEQDEGEQGAAPRASPRAPPRSTPLAVYAPADHDRRAYRSGPRPAEILALRGARSTERASPRIHR